MTEKDEKPMLDARAAVRETLTQELRTRLQANTRRDLQEAVKEALLYSDEEIERYLKSTVGQAQVDSLIQELEAFGELDKQKPKTTH